jgi:elongation factor P
MCWQWRGFRVSFEAAEIESSSASGSPSFRLNGPPTRHLFAAAVNHIAAQFIIGISLFEDFMAALIDAIDVKRKNFFEFENTPYLCLEAVVNTPTARGGQTLVRLKMRNLLTNAVFEKSFKANDKFKEPDLQSAPASYLYSDGDGSHFLDQQTFETLTLSEQMVGDALDFLVEGAIVELRKYNGNPIGLDLPMFVELKISETGPGVKGDTSSGSVTKSAKLETGLEIRVPLFLKEGEKVKVSTETREFGGRA